VGEIRAEPNGRAEVPNEAGARLSSAPRSQVRFLPGR
jgi:hypothetical protein